MKLNTIIRLLNKILSTSKIADKSRNGLQVRACKEVKKVAVAVDASMETFKAAKNFDLLIVHHGLFWKGVKDSLKKDRIKWLKKNKLSLYASHLPLDLHKQYGNNVILCKLLDLKNLKKFYPYHGVKIGFYGNVSLTLNQLNKKINKTIGETKSYNFGPKKVKRLGIVSGGGSGAIEFMKKHKIDTLLIGEFNHTDFHIAKEHKVNIIEAGHYATERYGVIALGFLLENKGLKVKFIDVPTGL